MSKLTTLLTGAGVSTIVQGQAQLESAIVIGDVDTAMPLQGIKISINGETKLDISGSQPLVSAFAKFMNRICGTVIGLIIRVATGRINGNTTYTFTNNGATVPDVYAFSDNSNGVPVIGSTKGINALSNETFTKFSALFITPSANVASLDVIWADGTTQNMSVLEMDAHFSELNDTEANGRLDAVVTTCDNRSQCFQSVKVNATTAVTVAAIKLPQSYFDSIK